MRKSLVTAAALLGGIAAAILFAAPAMAAASAVIHDNSENDNPHVMPQECEYCVFTISDDASRQISSHDCLFPDDTVNPWDNIASGLMDSTKIKLQPRDFTLSPKVDSISHRCRSHLISTDPPL
jgi:hypothetical protein